MLDDILYAVRGMLKNPRFAALTTFVMTIGLSLCIYMFSFIFNTLSGTIPLEDGERLRKVTTVVNGVAYDGTSVRYQEYLDIVNQQTSFEFLDAYDTYTVTVSTSDRAIRYSSHFVSEEFFKVSEAKPALGRLLTKADSTSNERVVVLGDFVWREMFASDPTIVGQKIRIDGKNHTVVGVTAPGYRFPDFAQMYMPFKVESQGIAREDSNYVAVYGLLKEGVSEQQANREMETIFAEFARQYPELNSTKIGFVWTFQLEKIGKGGDVLVLAMALAVLFILVLACVNVGNLLLSRAIERNKESAIRTALGAPRSVLIRQLMCESLIISVLSGCLAVLIAGCGLDLTFDYFLNSLPIEPPFWWQAGLTQASLIITVVTVLSTILITGGLPAWRATKTDINAVLRDGTRGAQSKTAGLLSKVIVGLEVTLSCALIMLSAAMLNLVSKMNDADYGVAIDNRVAARIALPSERYGKENIERAKQYYQTLEEKLTANPAIESVTFSQSLPHTWGIFQNISVEGVDYGNNPSYPGSNVNIVMNNYFSAMEMTLLEGRLFNNTDSAGTSLNAVVTKNFAEKHLAGENPIGKRIKLMEMDNAVVTIVGVTNNVIFGQPFDHNSDKASMFLAYEQFPRLHMKAVIKNAPTATAMHNPVSLLTKAAVELDADVAPYSITDIQAGIDSRLSGMNFIANIFILFAISSMVIAFSGIYGVMANSIVQKTQEIGVRRALGADNSNVYNHYLMQATKQLVAGLILGIPAGVLLVKMLEQGSMAEGSLLVYIGVPVLISLVIILAVVLPVRNTLNMEPSSALRHE